MRPRKDSLAWLAVTSLSTGSAPGTSSIFAGSASRSDSVASTFIAAGSQAIIVEAMRPSTRRSSPSIR